MGYAKSLDQFPHGREFFNAVDNGKELVREFATVTGGVHDFEMLVNGVQTAIIQNVGRFCESYANDVFGELAELETFLHLYYIDDDDRWVIPIGIRANGVDGGNMIKHRLSSAVSVSQGYRKVLAIDIVDTVFEEYSTRTIRLVDITNSLRVKDFQE